MSLRLAGVLMTVLIASLHAQTPRDSARLAFLQGHMPLHSTGVDVFAAAHPTWDGRGVLIAILDSGIDPGIPGLALTSDGSAKIVDLRDFSAEGNVKLVRAMQHGDTLVVGNRSVAGATRVGELSGHTAIWGGLLAEAPLGKAPAGDFNGNGSVNDTLLVIVAHTVAGWVMFADADGDGTLANDAPVRDYSTAHEYFGWHQPGHVAPLDIAANFTESNGTPALDLFFDNGSHGSHVSGIAAGHNLYGVEGFDGVAPGAQLLGLKIANDAQGGISVTASMERALSFAIAYAKQHNVPLVVNMSFGVGNEVKGTARIDAIVDSILAANPDVPMTIAAGNDGPALGTIGFPASASRALAIGATLPLAFQGGDPRDIAHEPIAPFSSRGGELRGPDLLAPGAAFSSIPPFAHGDEEETGTSMASPYAAGLLARLLGAARANHLQPDAATLAQALRAGATLRPGVNVVEGGAGIPDLTASWAWLAVHHGVPLFAIDVGGVHGRAAVLFTATAPAVAYGTRVTVRQVAGNPVTSLRVRATDQWIEVPETVVMVDGRVEFTTGIAATVTSTSGMQSGAIQLWTSDTSLGPVAVIPVTLRVPISGGATASPMQLVLAAGATGREFVRADTGRGFQVDVISSRPGVTFLAALTEPDGMPYRDVPEMPAGTGDGKATFDVPANDVVAGVYEVDAVAGPMSPGSVSVSVRQSPVRLGATVTHDSLHVSAHSLISTPLAVRLRAGLFGATRSVSVHQTGDAPIRIVVPVPAWSPHLVIDTRMPREQWSRFTDFGVTLLDKRGRIIDDHAINYAFSRAAIDLPDSAIGDTVTILLTPGFAGAHDNTSWTMDVDIKLYVGKPYSLDQGGSPMKPIAPGATHVDSYRLESLPLDLPAGFLPLITVIALDGTDNTWGRELTLPLAWKKQP